MTELLAAARSSYDVVVLDTSALLPVADGAVAASSADGVILLVRHGVTPREDVLRSVETLRAVNAPMLGAVLSMAPAGRTGAARRPAGQGRSARGPGRQVPPAAARPAAAAAAATPPTAATAQPADERAVVTRRPPATATTADRSSVEPPPTDGT